MQWLGWTLFDCPLSVHGEEDVDAAGARGADGKEELVESSSQHRALVKQRRGSEFYSSAALMEGGLQGMYAAAATTAMVSPCWYPCSQCEHEDCRVRCWRSIG